MDPNTLDQDARWRRFSCKMRIVDLQGAVARGDMEGVSHAARMVSGTLGPEGLRGASQFEMRSLVTSCASHYNELKDTLARIMDPFPVTAVSDALFRLSALETSVGLFHIWIKQPTRATSQPMSRMAETRKRL